MMDDLGYYLAVFRRRLPYFLIVTTVISAVSVIVAYTLPPAYESRMVLLMESPQIPENLATSTVQTPAFEQLQITEQRLMTRANLLDIAREYEVLPNLDEMSPDEIVSAMRARTRISTSNQFAREAPLMTITFEAPRARATAEVRNQYLVLMQEQENEFRKGRSGETLEFFSQEVARLGEDLDLKNAEILQFKQANADALPDSLDFRMGQQVSYQARLVQIDRDISDLKGQERRLLQLYELTGDIDNSDSGVVIRKSAEELQLDELNASLQAALAIYAPDNPRVRLLEARIAQIQTQVAAQEPEPAPETTPDEAVEDEPLPPVLQIQLDEVKSGILSLELQKATLQTQVDQLSETILRTPEVAIELEELEREAQVIQSQFNLAEDRLSKAQIGDRIETRSRGQRLSVIEQPSVPTEPTKPDRIKLAGAGTAFGIFVGLGLIALFELLNTSARRPEDIINRLGVTPLTTVPYIPTRGEVFRSRSLKLGLVLIILIGVPAAVYAVHVYYLPLDLIAEKIMNRLGVRL